MYTLSRVFCNFMLNNSCWAITVIWSQASRLRWYECIDCRHRWTCRRCVCKRCAHTWARRRSARSRCHLASATCSYCGPSTAAPPPTHSSNTHSDAPFRYLFACFSIYTTTSLICMHFEFCNAWVGVLFIVYECKHSFILLLFRDLSILLDTVFLINLN